MSGGISISDQFQVGWFLGSAAFCSGFLWQPFVNAFQVCPARCDPSLSCRGPHRVPCRGPQAPGVGYSFTTACALTTIGCGSAFYVGLRAGRQVYPTFFTPGVVMGPDYGNLQGDMQLSLSVGGATGVFVGTVRILSAGTHFADRTRNVPGGQPQRCQVPGCSARSIRPNRGDLGSAGHQLRNGQLDRPGAWYRGDGRGL